MTIKNLYPVVEPSLNLDFANSKRLDPRITFTRGSIGTYVGDDGLIKTAAQNEARFYHDSDGNSLGLLIEESRTNTYLYSTDLSQSGYGNTTPSAPSYPSPDGLNTASLMVPSAGGSSTRNFGRIDCGVTNAIQTASIYAKAAGYTAIGFNSISNGYSGDLTVFDLSTGTVTRADANSVNAYMEDIGNGWYRCVVPSSVAYGVAGATLISWYCIDQASTEFSPYSADGVSGIYVWGAQLEQGSFPTSYIPTPSSTCCRAADVASITGSNFSSWYNQSEGTVFADAICNGLGGSGGTVSFVGHIHDGTTNNYIDILRYQPTGNNIVAAGNAIQSNLSSSATIGSYHKSASTYKVNDFALSVDGAAAITDNSGSLPSPSILTLGNDSSNGRALNGTISRLAYYPQRLPDATLQAMTL